MHFVALDLETTGLSPVTDTIIEVAAVRFTLGKDTTGKYIAANIEERSMLVSPRREMTEEISMITGITDAMLAGKPIWDEVRERVREFIGDESVIVGHNVLFDTAMLATHGIDLSGHPVLDTFELSEIFSQDIESLNLGYLAGAYGLSAGDKEHRALGDTRLSVGLFIHYLNLIDTLSETKKSILTLTGSKESIQNIGLLTDITGIRDIAPLSDIRIIESNNQEEKKKEDIRRVDILGDSRLVSIRCTKEEEMTLLEESIIAVSTDIGVFGQRQADYMQECMGTLGYNPVLSRDESEFCSLEEIEERIRRGGWERKESILITKLLFWLQDTHTGLLRELKLYGMERDAIMYFRMQSSESSPFYESLKKDLGRADCVIYDLGSSLKRVHKDSTSHKKRQIIIKDISLLEEAMRRAESLHVSLEAIVGDLENWGGSAEVVDKLRWIESLYLGFPKRPTGPEISPPGGYGETYFMTQADIWHAGCVSLSLVTRALASAYTEWRSQRTIDNRHQAIQAERIDRAITAMIQFHTRESSNGIIIQIQENELKFSYIPRDVTESIRVFLNQWESSLLYGVGIHGDKIRDFIESEVGIPSTNIEEQGITNNTKKHITVNQWKTSELMKSGNLGGTVILTTSAKHVREIGKNLEKSGLKILMQGISGGKGKQLGLFLNNPESTVLIGTIDMWKEERKLWSGAKNIIIAKLPFDPPTDSYFLARTVGMKNNFSLYSEPMMIIKINTLLSRIYSSNYTGVVYCEDIRLTETNWGQSILREIV